MQAKTPTERSRDRDERMKAKGWKRLNVWIPAELEARIRAYINRLLKDWPDGR